VGALVLALLSLVGTGACASAAEVLVILSEDKSPYRVALDGLAKVLADAGHHATERLLDAVTDEADLARYAALVSIGSKASAYLHDHHPAHVPMAFCMVSDPIAAGLTTPPPFTGVATEVPLKTQIALIAEALPNARTLGMLYRGDQDHSREQVTRLRSLLPSDWRLEAIEIDQFSSVAESIDNLFAKPIDVVWTSPDSSIFTEATVRTLLLNALRKRVPVFGFSPAFVRAGGLLGIGINPLSQGAQSATIVLQQLASQSDPVGELVPPAFEIEINLIVAHKLSIELPAELVSRATHVYQAGR
jgi:putative ABC transport system substrate-binding protein